MRIRCNICHILKQEWLRAKGPDREDAQNRRQAHAKTHKKKKGG